MRKIITFFAATILLLATQNKLHAQDIELGGMAGIYQYMGDLSYTHVTWDKTKLGYGGLFRYYFNPRLSFKANIYYGNIAGADSSKPHVPGAAYTRGLSFKSHLLDISGQIEYNITPFISGNRLRNWAPYVFTGVSIFNFSPKTKYLGDWVKLQPLGTEGQGLNFPGYGPKYSLTQISIPYGVGFKYSFKRKATGSRLNLYLWNIGIEASQRKTFTDHLDDVGGYYPDFSLLNGGATGMTAMLSDRQGAFPGQTRAIGSVRGNPDLNDGYMMFVVTLTKTFRKNTCFCF